MPAIKAAKKNNKKARPVPKPVPVAIIQPPQEKPVDSMDFSAFPWRQRVTPIILLALTTFAVYLQVIHFPFSNYDDGEYITDNLKIQRGIDWPTIHWALTSTEHANWHPVTWLSHAMDWQLFGPEASGHHLTSLLLHVLNVALLFLFLARVTKSTARSLLVAALFAIHPIDVESVAWVAERKTVLCTTFFLLTLLAYAQYARRPNALRYLWVALLFVLSLASKPLAVTFPFVLLLLDYWPLQRIKGWIPPSPNFEAPQRPFWKLALEKLPLLACSAAGSVLTVIAQQKVSAIRSGAAYPLYLRIENAIFSYADYLWKLIWPTRLAVLYPYPAGGLPIWMMLLSVIVLAGCSFMVWRERSRRPYLITGWLWFLGMLVPMIGLVQVGEQAMADRYAYLSVAGLFLLAVWLLYELAEWQQNRLRWPVAGAGAIVLIALGYLCVQQVGYWKSNLDLWGHAASVTENNSVAEDVVGSEILVEAMNHGARYSDEAQTHFQNAVRIDPQDSEAVMNIGADLQVHGHLQEAIAKYKEALPYAKEDLRRAQILCDLGSAYEQSGEFVTARNYYQQSLQYHAKNSNIAFIGFARTFTDEKIAAARAQLAAHPSAKGFVELGQLQEAGAYNAEALASYQHALELDPKSEEARAGLDRASRSVNEAAPAVGLPFGAH